MVNNNFEIKVLREKKDNSGNFLALDTIIEGIKTTLITVYGPNQDSPDFFMKIQDAISLFDNDNYIICGDFNCVLNPKLDYDSSYKNINNPRARNTLLEIVENNGLIDIFSRSTWRDQKIYTWRKKTPIKQARLDYFLVSESLLTSIQTSSIEAGYRTDHSYPIIKLKLNEFRKGKGLWKFNNSLLQETEYHNLVKRTILWVKESYCLPIYNIISVNDIPGEDLQFSINDQLFLETLLMELRGETISYASYRKKTKNARENDLRENIQKLESGNVVDFEILAREKKQLEEIRIEKIKGSIIRSRAKWAEEGEKLTKYFFQLRK